jgi:ferredoxin-type protein NapH
MSIRIHKLQIARRLIQILVVAVVLAIPATARYANYLGARELDKTMEKWDGTLQGEALAVLDVSLRSLPNGELERGEDMRRNRTRVLSYAQTFRGGPWSAQIGPVSLTDPLAGAESVAAAKRLPKVLLVSLIIPVLVTLILGRVFCSWLCPMNLLLELSDKARRLLRFLELPPRDLRFSVSTKYILLGVGLVAALCLGAPILGYVYPPAIIGRELHDFVFGLFDRAEAGNPGFWLGGFTWMSLVILGIALFEVTVSRRWWCRYICPGGALYALLGWKRPVRVKLKPDVCTRCERCVEVCPVGLVPMDHDLGRECDNCGECVSHCPEKALDYGVGTR